MQNNQYKSYKNRYRIQSFPSLLLLSKLNRKNLCYLEQYVLHNVNWTSVERNNTFFLRIFLSHFLLSLEMCLHEQRHVILQHRKQHFSMIRWLKLYVRDKKWHHSYMAFSTAICDMPVHLSINKSLVHIGKFTRDENVYRLTCYRSCRSRAL